MTQSYFEIAGHVLESVVETPIQRPPSTNLVRDMKSRYGVPAPVTKEAAAAAKEKTGVDVVRLSQVPGRARRAKWAFGTAATLAMADGPLPFGDIAAIAVLSAYGTYEVVEAVGDIREGSGY